MPRFDCITTSGLMFVVTMETYELELLYSLNENAHFQKLFSFLTDTYLFYLKIQIKSVTSQAEIYSFSK